MRDPDTVIASILIGPGFRTLIWNSINNKVYCANYDSASVTIIDGANNSVITTVPVGNGPFALTWNLMQNRTYVANWSSSNVSVIRDEMPGIEERQTFDAECLMPEIFPNPAKSVMRVRIPLSVKAIKIFDVSGKLIKEIASTSEFASQSIGTRFALRNDNGREIKISLKGISPGIYFLRLGKETKKFLVVK